MTGSVYVLQAALGLLRVCTRLLPYKESSAEPLLKSLGLLLRLDPAVAWELAAPLSAELLKMVKASAAFIRSARGWKTVCALINMTALHPEASQASFEAFSVVCKDEKLLSGSNFAPCLETALVFLDRHAKVIIIIFNKKDYFSLFITFFSILQNGTLTFP